MQITTIGLDLAKNVFQVHGVDSEGRVVVQSSIFSFHKGLLQSRCKLALAYIVCRSTASNVMKTLASWAPGIAKQPIEYSTGQQVTTPSPRDLLSVGCLPTAQSTLSERCMALAFKSLSQF